MLKTVGISPTCVNGRLSMTLRSDKCKKRTFIPIFCEVNFAFSERTYLYLYSMYKIFTIRVPILPVDPVENWKSGSKTITDNENKTLELDRVILKDFAFEWFLLTSTYLIHYFFVNLVISQNYNLQVYFIFRWIRVYYILLAKLKVSVTSQIMNWLQAIDIFK